MGGQEGPVATDISAPTAGRLVVCPTPIGNLADITLRVLDVLRTADVLACEDTRRTRVLLDRYEIAAKLISFHEHNERGRLGELVRRIGAGETVALVSDAGMPVVSDPGFLLVRACVEQELAVEVLPGPSSVISALVVSGLPAERWRFEGFLSRRRAELVRLFGESGETLVAFESPARLATTLALLTEIDQDRPVVVCRELTKLHEEIRRGCAAELAGYYREHPPRGEIVLVVGASDRPAAGREQALAALRELVQAGARPRPAAAVVARLSGIGANELYRSLVSKGGDTASGLPGEPRKKT